jgi:hypothetical protein
MSNHARPLAVVALVLVVAACGGAATSATPTPAASAPPSVPAATPTPVPVPSASDGAGGAGGSGVAGNPGAGGGVVDPAPGGGAAGDPTLVKPVAGLAGIHAVAASSLEATVTGRRVTVRVSWTSGVEPCYALAGVDVVRDGSMFTLTVAEGSAAAPDTMCIEIAMFKATDVDLGELEPGAFTVIAFGDARPIEVVVPG